MRLPLLSLLAATFAAALPSGSILRTTAVVVEGVHGARADAGVSNSTIIVPVGPLYRNKTVLAAVTALYILRDDAISCIPYYAEIATGPHGHPFTFNHPVTLSEEPVVVGSILCTQ
ncbi:hypothetical protein GGR51DRAFT_572668 [Nemania sp. FL0031]|nr:hypothetical protein GGR51DRAFT_572668 [Nemania sp. FL0031]